MNGRTPRLAKSLAHQTLTLSSRRGFRSKPPKHSSKGKSTTRPQNTFGQRQSSKARVDNAPLPRPDTVLIAQLRSGHCRKLAAYRNIVDANVSPNCPYCVDGIETLEHWLQDCPATAAKRFRVMGGVAPQLSILVTNPRAVLAFAH